MRLTILKSQLSTSNLRGMSNDKRSNGDKKIRNIIKNNLLIRVKAIVPKATMIIPFLLQDNTK